MNRNLGTQITLKKKETRTKELMFMLQGELATWENIIMQQEE
jgi:hypothetical protein